MIRAISLGKYIEPGQEDTKNSLDKFFEIFERIFADIEKMVLIIIKLLFH